MGTGSSSIWQGDQCVKETNTDQVTLGLTANVQEAHRQLLLHAEDRQLVGCQIELGCEEDINAVGTFGVSSTSSCWRRVVSTNGRLPS